MDIRAEVNLIPTFKQVRLKSAYKQRKKNEKKVVGFNRTKGKMIRVVVLRTKLGLWIEEKAVKLMVCLDVFYSIIKIVFLYIKKVWIER